MLDASNLGLGKGLVVHEEQPRNEKELRTILSGSVYPLVIVGAQTGLAGGCVPSVSGSRILTDKLTSLDAKEGFFRVSPGILIKNDFSEARVSAGIRISELNAYLKSLKLFYPPHPGETSATIGGNVSTNASGPKTFSFGSTRNFVTYLKIILSDGDSITINRGEILANERKFRLITDGGRMISGDLPGYQMPKVKHSAGLYAVDHMDLIDLFIGSEGILGVITEVGIRLIPEMKIEKTSLLFSDEAKAIEFVNELKSFKFNGEAGVISIEYLDLNSLKISSLNKEHLGSAECCIEFEHFNGQILDRLLTQYKPDYILLDPENADILRYSVPRNVAKSIKDNSRSKLGTDIAVPSDKFPEMFDLYKRAMALALKERNITTALWGHISSEHLHLNFFTENEADRNFCERLYDYILTQAVRMGGSVSAEHGVGKKSITPDGDKYPLLEYQYGTFGLLEVARVKRLFDRKLILGLDNMVPHEIWRGGLYWQD